jgi:hypothetical protein
MKTPIPGVRANSLFGGHLTSPKVIKTSMDALGAEWEAEFRERLRVRKEIEEQVRKSRAPLVEILRADKRAVESVNILRQLRARARVRTPPQVHPSNVKERVFTGSIGATMVPPYNYQWTWSASDGSGTEIDVIANELDGGIYANNMTSGNDNDSSIGWAAAVGINFYPMTANGTLQVWATPKLNYQWGDYSDLDTSAQNAWIGIYIGSYDLSGAFTGAIVNQQTSLWSDSSWWSATTGSGSNTGFGLSSAPVQVDQDHTYAIWVWAGGELSGRGFGSASGSGASQFLYVATPSITWRLG